jgi:Mannosylglycerate hydrolase MGH1-like glycoside hydrolase domain/Glycosyl hydrolase family 65, C-terminal domain
LADAQRHSVRLRCSDPTIERAFGIALEDLAMNIVPSTDGLLEREEPVFRAGAGYEKPWTRDAAINVWNGAGLLFPSEARNTLLATLERENGRLVIAAEYDQYWDSIIWLLGAWSLYLFIGDSDLLAIGLDAARNTVTDLERTEFDADSGLFRGPAVYGDGVAAYPDIYARTVGGHSSILRWAAANPELASKPGHGLPMHALSTNCLYVAVYRALVAAADELGALVDATWETKATSLCEAIDRHFWLPERGHYRYLVDPFDGSDVQEGLGHALAILFGIADAERRDSIFRIQHVTSEGIPCLWPPFVRYRRSGGYGRHSGTVWPPVQGFWAEAAARYGRDDLLGHELWTVARRAVRDGQFFELYHPDTGLPYGGLQEWEGRGIVDTWESYPHQTWSATSFLRMILLGVIGMRFEPGGVRFQPVLPPGLRKVKLEGIRYRNASVEIDVRGAGTTIVGCLVDGEDADPFLPAGERGNHVVEVVLGGGSSGRP